MIITIIIIVIIIIVTIAGEIRVLYECEMPLRRSDEAFYLEPHRFSDIGVQGDGQLASGRWLSVVRTNARSCEPKGFDSRGRLCALLFGKSA